MTRIIGTIEARMGSSRLPGKTLLPVYNGMPLLECVVRRFRACQSLDDVVVATTVEKGDDAIAAWCNANDVSVFRGSEENVLERVAGAAQQFGADAIVQMGADSAYLDYQLIDQLVGYYRGGNFDYVCNDLQLTYPLGIYGHVVRVEKLKELSLRQDLSNKDRSDVVRYFWEHPEAYAIANIEAPLALNVPDLRLTIDYPEDMEQAMNVYAHFGSHLFTTAQVIELKRQKPELFEKTRNLVQQSAPFLPA
ncbi:MAG TPA: NTP transferase domain-containing protein [Sideroxyarcus sp.]|nr:NTP transferase domain-containing protein [Sideroxyarcus sp.]